MPKYLIERNIPGAGSLSPEELRAASVNSNGVLARLGPEVQWVHSYVTQDKITCVYIAPNEEMVRKHARQAGLPADAVMPIRTRIDPTTAEAMDVEIVSAHAPGGGDRRPAGALKSLAWLALATTLTMGSAACEQVSAPEASLVPEMSVASGEALAPDVERDLAALRQTTAPYHRFEAAQRAGWTALVPGCRDNQPVGGMGWHYANPAYLDREVEVRKPEALIYEPQKNGTLELVGIEYVVPFSVLPPEAEPPELFGQAFQHNFGDELWMLHVWAWRHNRDGIFATWNPDVDCRYAG
jgi:hypothetical protein